MCSKDEQQEQSRSGNYQEWRLLNELEDLPEVSQRQLAVKMGIALGLTNVLVRRLIQKGYLRVSKATWKRRLYNLKPEGLAHKLQLTKSYITRVNQDRYAGCVDWRMPTRKEVETIFDPSNPVTDKYGDTILLAPEFPPGAEQTCWTKTLHKTDKALVIRFQFYNGDYKWHQMGLRSHGVRAVRPIKK